VSDQYKGSEAARKRLEELNSTLESTLQQTRREQSKKNEQDGDLVKKYEVVQQTLTH
jgi:hypothetical protein